MNSVHPEYSLLMYTVRTLGGNCTFAYTQVVLFLGNHICDRGLFNSTILGDTSTRLSHVVKSKDKPFCGVKYGYFT